MVDLNNEEELEEFLSALPHRARVSFAARATLRAAPAAFQLASQQHFDSFRQKYLLTCIRANLVAATAATLTVSEINSEFDRSTEFSFAIADSDDPNERGSHNYIVAARSAIFAALSAAVSTLSARHARAAAVSSRGAARSDLSADVADSAALSFAPNETHQLFATSLWPSGAPDVLANAIRNFENSSPGTPWAFWAKWYRGMLDGKPLDWELQRRVALIDDAIWEAGAEAVAQEIERIEQLFDLEREIAALKNMLPLRSALSSTSLIGDNGGPPLDDGVQRAVRDDFVLVWDQIEDLEAEIAKPEPSPGRLKAIAKTLWDISVRIATYCGGKIDLALTEASKEAGKVVVKWGAPIVIASLASQNEGIQQVFKAIGAFVKTLPPG
ncbi:hypothetical protein [Ruegeria aquimaris]|uniref:Uncharacterized protein n=1 Tax=Ruegeria aquimaris TaxID=2984333 RepID=A0ABT3AJ16_9RHOB|nr:hypothetical protein [Ruegeria sp. XHP0148]MCV2888572.1 hypothetical protein [Ruegeria sp. XHP0148]